MNTRTEQDALDKAILASAIDKVARKLARVKHNDDDLNVHLQISVGELRMLKQFHSKFFDA